MPHPAYSDFGINDANFSSKDFRSLVLTMLDRVLDLQERLGIISIDDRLDNGERIRSEAQRFSEMSADECRSRIDDIARDIEALQRELDAQIRQAFALPDCS